MQDNDNPLVPEGLLPLFFVGATAMGALIAALSVLEWLGLIL